MDQLWRLVAEVFIEKVAPNANPVRSLEHDCGATDITAILTRNGDSADPRPQIEPNKMRETHDNIIRHIRPGRMTSLANRSKFDLLKKIKDDKANFHYRRSKTQGCSFFRNKIPDYMINVEFIGVRATRLPQKMFYRLLASERIDCITPFMTRFKSFYVVTKVYKAEKVRFEILIGDKTKVISKNDVQLAFEYTKVNITPQRKLEVLKEEETEENTQGQLFLETMRKEGKLAKFFKATHKEIVETLQSAFDEIEKKSDLGGLLQTPLFEVECFQ
ncbi:uncharacterized protein [Antedon mediterranea]|uniref:uncharacterized protein n=1 Tax=Antedon mediterranea TaxID=105859 RepID=UPI003AF69673